MSVTRPYVPPAITPPERQLPLLKAVRTMIDNPMEGWPRAVYEDLTYIPPRREFPTIFMCDPGGLRTVLVDEVAKFPKAAIFGCMIKPMLGEALLTADGAHWKWQRQATAPLFRADRVQATAGVISSVAEEAFSDWASRHDGRRIDLFEEMSRVAFDVIVETMLAGRSDLDGDEVNRQLLIYLRQLGKPTIFDLLGAPIWMRSAFAPRAASSVRFLHDLVDGVIARRRREG